MTRKHIVATGCILLGIGLFCGLQLTAFNWPQEPVTQDSFYSVFGQLRGTKFNSSLVFAEPAEIHPAEAGTVLAILGGNDGETGWFESPLGNTVILAHENDVMSVYANLETVDITGANATVTPDSILGTSGSSGWQHGQSSLEFQMVDIKEKTVINPRLLMPHMNSEQIIRLSGITAVNRSGEVYELRTRRNLPAGMYQLYRSRGGSAMPYTTTVSVNGAAVETITFDALQPAGRQLVVEGKNLYPAETVYKRENQQLLAEVTFSPGRNTLNITAADFNGGEYSISYIIEAR